jgi:hypothetical protein
MLGTLLYGAPSAAFSAEAPASETYFDFRNGHVPPELRFVGRSDEFIHPEAEGLRITLRKKDALHPRVNLDMDTSITGDFEITITFEILEAEAPRNGDAGYGVGILVEAWGSVNQVPRIGWYVRGNGDQVVLWDLWGRKERQTMHWDTVPTPHKSGRLRLSRTGNVLQYLWSGQTTGDNFESAYQCEFSEDLNKLRLVAETYKLARNLDVRFVDLRVRGGKVFAQQGVPSFWLIIAIVTLLVVSIVVGWTYARRHRQAPLETAAPEPSAELPEIVIPTAQRHRPGIFWLTGTGLLALAAALACATASLGFLFTSAERAANNYTNVYYHDFRGRTLPPELTLFNVEKDELLQLQPGGARIKIPNTWIHPWGGVGFTTAFGITGDFETTITFEILHADTPPKGYGVGVEHYIGKRDGGGAFISRLVRPTGEQMVLWGTLEPKGQGKLVNESPCMETVGRLRLRRTGTTLHYLWGSGTQGEDFQEKQQLEFGTADIEVIRVTALTGRTPSKVEARILDLGVRWRPPGLGSRVWLLAAMLVGLLIALALAVHAWLNLRRRRKVTADPP